MKLRLHFDVLGQNHSVVVVDHEGQLKGAVEGVELAEIQVEPGAPPKLFLILNDFEAKDLSL